MANTNDSPYRVVSVGKTGVATRKTFSTWKTAYYLFSQIKQMKHIRYAAIIELTEDANHAGIKEEYYAGSLKS